MAPKISVIIPCYNQAHFLSEAVSSVLSQTFNDWECIIVNDGSTDNTEVIALDFTSKDNNIKYIKKANGGLSSARNAGLAKSSGEWIQFLDADDIIEPAKFMTQLKGIYKKGIYKNTVSFTDYRYGGHHNIYQQDFEHIKPAFATNNFLGELISRWETTLIIPPHCFLFSSDFFLQHDIRFDETLPNHEDFDCWLRIFSKNPTIFFIDEILCRYRRSDNSMSTNMRLMGEGFLQVINNHIDMKSYSLPFHNLFKNKKLDVLQRYKRFDIMTWKDKLLSWKVLLNYYVIRVLQKSGLKAVSGGHKI